MYNLRMVLSSGHLNSVYLFKKALVEGSANLYTGISESTSHFAKSRVNCLWFAVILAALFNVIETGG